MFHVPRICTNLTATAVRWAGVSALAASLLGPVGAQVPLLPPPAAPDGSSGIVFECGAQHGLSLQNAVDGYFAALGIAPTWVTKTLNVGNGFLSYAASANIAAIGTLNLIDQQQLGVSEELVKLPTAHGRQKTVITVSKKEIVLAMLQPGRTTLFSGQACDVQALKDHVAIRQNIVAWTEALEWKWPDGGPARWNTTYWRRGTPRKGVPLHVAVNDAFINQKRYAIGCYTATKLVMVQGILDYFKRIKRDPQSLALVEAQMRRGGEPLSFIEPGVMWQFESDITDADLARPGKLLGISHGVPAGNFIPGDWSYFLNTDPVTYAKTGYEGSNAVYLGRGKFDDFYDDHHHYYTYKEKLHEVYQWRNKVFSASRDVARVKPLSALDFERISATPALGGIVLDLRVFPLLFGFEDLPRHAFLQ